MECTSYSNHSGIRVVAESLESRVFLSTSAINPSDAIPFKQIVIDPNPGTVPVVKLLADLTNDGNMDAVVGHENSLGGGGLDWYQFPASGNPNDPWTEHVIDKTADVYESARAVNISGHVDSTGKPVMDLIVCERGTVYWYENPLGDGLDPTTATWTRHLVGTISQGATHEMYLADLDGDGKLDIVTTNAIFFQNSPTSWTQVANPTYNRTQKGLYLFDSGSGSGNVDLLGTGEGPSYQVGWYENPRDHGGNARTGNWIFHPVGPTYGNFTNGAGISYAAMDVNGDGHEDIITCDGEEQIGAKVLTGGLIWWQAPVNGDAVGSWTPHTIDASVTDVHNLVLGDMNGDGTPEILAFEQDQSPQGRLMIVFNEGGTGQNWLEQVISSDATVAGGYGGAHNESIGDITGDGDLDILTSPHGYFSQVNPISVWMNQLSTNGTVAPNITAAPASQSAGAGSAVTFSVTATGTGPLTYQWQDNGLDIPNANGAKLTVTASTGTNGQVYRCIVGNPAGLIASGGATLTLQGALSGTVASAPSTYDLTALGSSDWAHWGRAGIYGSFDHKASGGSQISNISTVGDASGDTGGSDSSRAASWTDGTPTGSDSGEEGYIQTNPVGSGFSFTVPADTNSRTLTVYAGGRDATTSLTAHLSDGSAVDFKSDGGTTGIFTNAYTITFQAASANQTLTVTLLKTADLSGQNTGTADLVAATLAGGSTAVDTTPPAASLQAPSTITSAGSTPETLTVVYTDNVAVKLASLASVNLSISGPQSVTASFVSASSGSDGPTITATYSVAAPAGGWSNASNGTYTVSLASNSVSDTSGNFAAGGSLGSFSVNIPASTGGGSLSGSSTSAPSSYNLTTLGTSDWAHWGRGSTYGNFDHKASGGSQISNVSIVGSGANYGGYYDNSRNATWTDGTPAASDTNEHGYIWSNGSLNTGFSFTVPADTTSRTLTVYAGGINVTTSLTAHLSDGSAADFVAKSGTTGLFTNVYTITYKAASAGQKLTITLLKTGNLGGYTNGSADLIAATLAGGSTAVDTTPPAASLQAPSTITSAGSTPETLTVVYTDNVAVKLASLASGNLSISGPQSVTASFVSASSSSDGPTITATYSVAAPAGGWSNASNGTYTVSLASNSISDTSGNFAAGGSLGSFSVNVPASTGGGSLAGKTTAAPSSYNLTTLGAKDWAHWGRGGTYGNFDHKASGGSQISNVSIVGSGANYGGYYDNSRNASWTDGTPKATDTNEHGYIWSNGSLNTGFSFTVPADTTTRTLTIYAGGINVTTSLTAHLSDGSAADFVAKSGTTGLFTNVYTITYKAASAGQKLTITLLKTGNLGGYTNGSADLIAATLA